MRLRALLVFVVLALALTVLSGFVPALTAVIDPLLAVAVVASLSGRLGAALGAGLLTGLVEDSWSSSWFGVHALVHVVIAYVLSMLAGRVDLTDNRLAALALVAASVANWGLQLALALLFDRPIADPPGFGEWIAAAVCNTILGLAVLRIARRLEAI